jgi:hypothetical protein
MLTSDRVADGEVGDTCATLGEDEEAIAGGLQIEGGVKPGDWLELAAGGPVVEGEEIFIAGASVLGSGDEFTRDDGEGGLVGVVSQEEAAGGDGAAPSAADGAAAEERLRGEADEDLPDGDLLREAAAGWRRSRS